MTSTTVWAIIIATALLLIPGPVPDYGPPPPVQFSGLVPIFREANYAGGSCVHASWATVLRWQGQGQAASDWLQTHSGGETPSSMTAKLLASQLEFSQTVGEYDIAWLDWAMSNRRGAAVVVMGGRHMVTLVQWDTQGPDQKAYILDNNKPDRLLHVPKEKFLADWKASGSWAFTAMYRVPPPLPHSEDTPVDSPIRYLTFLACAAPAFLMPPPNTIVQTINDPAIVSRYTDAPIALYQDASGKVLYAGAADLTLNIETWRRRCPCPQPQPPGPVVSTPAEPPVAQPQASGWSLPLTVLLAAAAGAGYLGYRKEDEDAA